MSSYVYSRIAIEEEIKRRMEEERRRRLEEERKKAEKERKELIEAREKLKKEVNSINSIKQELLLFSNKLNNSSDVLLKEKCFNLIEDINKISQDIEGDKILLDKKRTIISEKKINILKAKDEITHKYKENIIGKSIYEANTTQEVKYYNLTNNICIEDNNDTDYLESLQEYLNSSEIMKCDKVDIEKFIEKFIQIQESEDTDKTYNLSTYKSIIHGKITDAKKNYMYMKDNFYDEYVINCSILNENCKDLCDFSDNNELETEIKKQQEDIEKMEEMKYVSSCIEKVLLKNGNRVIRTDVISSEKRNYNKHYVEFGNNGVAIIKHSSDGAVVMETAYVSDNDILSEKEEEQAFDNIKKLCEYVPIIEKGLKEEGIDIDTERIIPPDRGMIKIISKSNFGNVYVNADIEEEVEDDDYGKKIYQEMH